MLERELTKLAGDNWQVRSRFIFDLCILVAHARMQDMLDISASPAAVVPTRALLGRRGSISSSMHNSENPPTTTEATLAQIEQVRLLVLGMEQRLQSREESLTQIIQRAEGEGVRFEELRKSALATKT